MSKTNEPKRDGYTLIYRPYYRTKDGRIVYAKWFGKKAFPMWVKSEK